VRFFLQACPCSSPWLSGEGLPVLGHKLLERRRLASAVLGGACDATMVGVIFMMLVMIG